ncbi:MAG TPA: VWA domain-containing protein [Solirubrobacteraceae bacterium]|jgi:Ca-activated chloride channel family protein
MSFREPAYLGALAVVPLLLLLYAALQRRRREAAAAFASPALMPNVVTGSPGWRRHVPVILLLAALAALVVAVARPERTVAQPKRQATVMLVTDVSGSMNADDVEPTRMRAAQDAARTFVEKVPKTFRVGLVSFNEQAALQLPPTTDRAQIDTVIESLRADGGTAMGDGLASAVEAIRAEQERQQATGDQRPPAAIILLSDGKNTVGAAQPLEVATVAAGMKIPIYTVALGTPDGAITVQDPLGFSQTIPVPPDPETLRQIAGTTKARFFDAPDASELQSVYKALGTRIGFEESKEEVTAAFAGGGLVLLLLGGAFGLRWFGRPI